MAAEDQHAQDPDLIERVIALEAEVKALQDQVQATKKLLEHLHPERDEPDRA